LVPTRHFFQAVRAMLRIWKKARNLRTRPKVGIRAGGNAIEKVKGQKLKKKTEGGQRRESSSFWERRSGRK